MTPGQVLAIGLGLLVASFALKRAVTVAIETRMETGGLIEAVRLRTRPPGWMVATMLVALLLRVAGVVASIYAVLAWLWGAA